MEIKAKQWRQEIQQMFLKIQRIKVYLTHTLARFTYEAK